MTKQPERVSDLIARIEDHLVHDSGVPPLPSGILDNLTSDWRHDHCRSNRLRLLADLHDRIVEDELALVQDGPSTLTIDLRPIRHLECVVYISPYGPHLEHYARLSNVRYPHGCSVNLPISVTDCWREPTSCDDDVFTWEGISGGPYLVFAMPLEHESSYIDQLPAGILRVEVSDITCVSFREDDMFLGAAGVSQNEWDRGELHEYGEQ